MRVRLAVSMALVVSTSLLQAIYVPPDLVRVPIDRVIANLARKVEQSPGDAEALLNLGRAYAMAWSRGEAQVEVARGENELWFGFEHRNVPFDARSGPSTGAARQHLDHAVEQHRRAAQLKPDDLVMQLGYAWCLDQAGRTSEAIPLYRRIVAEAWKREGTLTSLDLGEYPIAEEAAQYLVNRLDRTVDAEEIADLRAKMKQLAALPRPITPIVVPLDDRADSRSGDDIVDPSASVPFDLDGAGRADAWQWIAPRYGWLVYDHDGSGRIDSALQMFGSVTFWMFWENGYQALAALDDNGDGELAGDELRRLAIWADRNGDGRSDPGEVRPLAAHGIVAVSCAFTRGAQPHLAAMSVGGVRLANGRVRPTFDVILRRAT
jgi:tetratricopeptide (TPR) repeat protein